MRSPPRIRGGLAARLAVLVGGLALFALGIVAFLESKLGLAPWDVFHQGVAGKTGLSIGTVVVILSFLVLLLWIPLRELPGLLFR